MEKCDSKSKIIVRFGVFIGLIIFGLWYGVLQGYSIINNGDTQYNIDIKSSSLKPTPIPDERDENIVGNPYFYLATVHFKTNDVFAVNNPFSYKMIVWSKIPNQLSGILSIEWVISNPMEIPTTDDIQSQIKNGVGYQALPLTRNPSDNSFRGEITDRNITSEQDLGFILIPVFTNGTLGDDHLILQEDPLKIYPLTAELQAQTDRDIQRQNIETAKTNAHVEGLTYIIIGLVPIALSGEILIHRYLT
jgi:hypothetical protein